MKLRRTPTVATSVLKLFCSTAQHESVIGDLMEQYQQGRGRFWYWRQVVAIVFFGLYRSPERPLISKDRFPMGAAFAVLLVIAGLVAVLLTEIWPILLIPVVVGSYIGGLKFLSNKDQTPGQTNASVTADVVRIARIDSSKIPITGGLWAGVLILVLFTAMLHDVPVLRRLAVPGLLGGLVFAVVLRLWGRFHPRDITKEWLSIKPK